MILDEQAKVWIVRYTVPKEMIYPNQTAAPRIYQQNNCSVVIAKTVGTAVSAVLQHHLDATIISVNQGPSGSIMLKGDEE